MDENSSIGFFDRLAVGLARMVDPPRLVTANLGIYDFFAVVYSKQKRVCLIDIIWNISPGNATPGIFDDALSFSNPFRSKHTAAVDWRFTYFDRTHQAHSNIRTFETKKS